MRKSNGQASLRPVPCSSVWRIPVAPARTRASGIADSRCVAGTGVVELVLGRDEVEKTLDTPLCPVHILVPLVRNAHWGVARGSDSLRVRASTPWSDFLCDSP
jgi:hypothetical protein